MRAADMLGAHEGFSACVFDLPGLRLEASGARAGALVSVTVHIRALGPESRAQVSTSLDTSTPECRSATATLLRALCLVHRGWRCSGSDKYSG